MNLRKYKQLRSRSNNFLVMNGKWQRFLDRMMEKQRAEMVPDNLFDTHPELIPQITVPEPTVMPLGFVVKRKKDDVVVGAFDHEYEANAMIAKAKAGKKAALYIA